MAEQLPPGQEAAIPQAEPSSSEFWFGYRDFWSVGYKLPSEASIFEVDDENQTAYPELIWSDPTA
jgi:hypothetical protein